MGVIKVGDIRDQIDELVTRLEAGETILVQKDGTTIARIEPVKPAEVANSEKKNNFDWDGLKRLTDSLPPSAESAADLIRRMRDESY